MALIILDPIVLTLADPCHNEKQLLDFFTVLMSWSAILDQDSQPVIILDDTVQALWEENAYPADSRLRQAIAQFTPKEQLPVDLASSLVTALVEKNSFVASQHVPYEVIYSKNDSISPAAVLTRLPSKTSSAWAYSIVAGALIQADTCEEVLVATADVSATVLDVSSDIEDSLPSPAAGLPLKLAEQLKVFLSANDLLKSLGIDPAAVPRFHSVLEAVEEAKRLFTGGLVFLAEAFSSAEDSPYRDTGRVFKALKALHDIALERQRNSDSGGSSGPLELMFSQRGLKYATGVTQLTRTTYEKDYTVIYQGRKEWIDPHVKMGVSQAAEYCLRIYFFTEPNSSKFVIAHVGRHKPGGQQK